MKITAIDLFCGAGGFTCGIQQAGIRVAVGFDNDPTCRPAYAANNGSRFLEADVAQLSGVDLYTHWKDAKVKVLIAGAPCQPFSTITAHEKKKNHRSRNLIDDVARLVGESKPSIVVLENVPNVVTRPIYKNLIRKLKDAGFYVSVTVVDAADFGVPQHRRRAILMASRFGRLALPVPSVPHHVTVREAIGNLSPIESGETWIGDPLHKTQKLAPLNLARIKASKPGGDRSDWDKALWRKRDKKNDNTESFKHTYSRMIWDAPANTLTTQFFNFGSGRFGHPEQDRTITLREGAILQGFPKNYTFAAYEHKINIKPTATLIGNAVPPPLAKAIGEAILAHVQELPHGEAPQRYDPAPDRFSEQMGLFQQSATGDSND